MYTWMLLFTLVLLVPYSALAQSGSISGMVTGQDFTGVVVIACLLVNDNCDQQQSRAVQVDAGGRYKIEDLGAGPYLILAWRDLNGSSELDTGDEAAVYSKDGKTPTPLKPPQQKIDLRLRAYDGSDASLLTAPQATAGAQGSVLGTWVYTSSNAGITYTLEANSTYIYAYRIALTLQSGCTRAGVYTPPYSMLYITGTYRVVGDQITFTPRTGTYTSDTSCNKIERPTSRENMEPKTYTWRVGEYAGSPALFLTDANGEQVYWSK